MAASDTMSVHRVPDSITVLSLDSSQERGQEASFNYTLITERLRQVLEACGKSFGLHGSQECCSWGL